MTYEWVFSAISATVGVFSLIVTYIVGAKAGKKQAREEFQYFSQGTAGGYNTEFYDYFIRLLDGAKSCVYITGEGFEGASSEGNVLAQNFHDAIKRVLRRNVQVVRVQTRPYASEMWASMLAELVQTFPESFELYALREESVAEVVSTCVIDPEHPDGTVAELMISLQRFVGTKPTNIAGVSLFIHKNGDLARELRDRIVKLTQPDLAVHLTDSAMVVPFLSGKEYYFAYGSNMNAEQMKRRVPTAAIVGTGFIPDHSLVFNRKGSYRLGGVASVARADGKRVYGTIWKVPAAELSRMDAFEDPSAYSRHKMEVVGTDGSAYNAHVYVAIPQGTFQPDRQYLDLLIESAKLADLPSEYVRSLENLRT